MAIQFARAEYASRSQGKNACCKSAYNARERIKDHRSNVTYTFERLKDNAFHEILLPSYVSSKFKDPETFSNAVEFAEKRKNSQLYKEYVLALPDNAEVNLKDRIDITKRFIAAKGFIDHGLGVQVDIHQPHDDEKNWHAHLLVTTRRFDPSGEKLGEKARDFLDPQVRGGRKNTYVNKDAISDGAIWKEIQNAYFKEKGYNIRVDEISSISERHLGPIRMRGLMNEAALANEERKMAVTQRLQSGEDLLREMSRYQAVFSKEDLIRRASCLEGEASRASIIDEALSSSSLLKLHSSDEKKSTLFTTHDVRRLEERCLRFADRLSNRRSTSPLGLKGVIDKLTQEAQLSPSQGNALKEIITSPFALSFLKGRAGTGKSHVLGLYKTLYEDALKGRVIGLAPTHKALEALREQGYEERDTLKGFLFKGLS